MASRSEKSDPMSDDPSRSAGAAQRDRLDHLPVLQAILEWVLSLNGCHPLLITRKQIQAELDKVRSAAVEGAALRLTRDVELYLHTEQGEQRQRVRAGATVTVGAQQESAAVASSGLPCEHEWVVQMIHMPEGYDKPGASKCRKCGAFFGDPPRVASSGLTPRPQKYIATAGEWLHAVIDGTTVAPNADLALDANGDQLEVYRAFEIDPLLDERDALRAERDRVIQAYESQNEEFAAACEERNALRARVDALTTALKDLRRWHDELADSPKSYRTAMERGLDSLLKLAGDGRT